MRIHLILIAFCLAALPAMANYYQAPPAERHQFTVYPASVQRDILGNYRVVGKYGEVPCDLPIDRSAMVGMGWVCTGDMKTLDAENAKVDAKLATLAQQTKSPAALRVRAARQQAQDALQITEVLEVAPPSAVPPSPTVKSALEYENVRIQDSNSRRNLFFAAVALVLAGVAGITIFGREKAKSHGT